MACFESSRLKINWFRMGIEIDLFLSGDRN